MNTLPILYSFRRCPYAIRARMTLAYAEVPVILREVLLKNKPPAMLKASGKGTVPVLVLSDGSVVDESIDVMDWALRQSDPDGWSSAQADPSTGELIARNDGAFKHWLDRYKYADRFPEHAASWYRDQAEGFLATLEDRLVHQPWLAGDAPGYVDVALFPFIRQFRGVDIAWFDSADYPSLRRWLQVLLDSKLFNRVMTKYAPWVPGDDPILFPARETESVIDSASPPLHAESQDSAGL